MPPLPGADAVEQRRAELTLAQPTLASREAALYAAPLKIQALTLELAHHKRLRFGQKREALAAHQGGPVRRNRADRPGGYRSRNRTAGQSD